MRILEPLWGGKTWEKNKIPMKLALPAQDVFLRSTPVLHTEVLCQPTPAAATQFLTPMWHKTPGGLGSFASLLGGKEPPRSCGEDSS